MSICNVISSCLPAFNQTNFSRFVMGTAGLGCLWAGLGLSTTILAMGATYFVKEKLLGAFQKTIDGSARLLPPSGQAAAIQNQNNSCFCSSILWTFFANMPEALRELPESINRRLKKVLLLNKKGPFTLEDFNRAREILQVTERRGGILGEKDKELLSLLELHDLIREFQKTPLMQGNRVNDMRKMAKRVNENFEGVGTKTGDAHELFQALAPLIFEGSRLEQNVSSPTPSGGIAVEKNWGDFVLPLVSEPSPSLAAIFLSEIQGKRFDSPPPFLALALKRHVKKDPLKKDEPPRFEMSFAPIVPDQSFRIEGKQFRTGQEASYGLVGVSRRLPERPHYDAVWKRPNGTWYYGDDQRGANGIYPTNEEDVSKMASTGCLFFYCKIN